MSLEDTPYYHCVSRCVRRAFLCGEDSVTGKSYEHRRQWMEDRIHLLADNFAIDVCAYAVMSNHTHVVLHINQDTASDWSVEEVILHWHRLDKSTLLSQRYMVPDERRMAVARLRSRVSQGRTKGLAWVIRITWLALRKSYAPLRDLSSD